MKFNWVVLLNTKDKHKIPVLINRLQEQLEVSISISRSEQMHSDKNWKVYFSTSVSASTWSDAIVEGLVTANKVAYSWQIMGDAISYFESCAKDSFSLSGVLWLEWSLSKEEEKMDNNCQHDLSETHHCKDGQYRQCSKCGLLNVEYNSKGPKTGIIQFGEDQTGVFIRRDAAANYAGILKETLDKLNINENK